MRNPIRIEAEIMVAFRQAFGNEVGITLHMELDRAIRDDEFPVAVVSFESSDIRPRIAGDDPKFAAVAGNRFVHRYSLDISIRNTSLSSSLMQLVDMALEAPNIFNSMNPDILMVLDGAEGIARTEDMRDDIRSIRLRIRCEST